MNHLLLLLPETFKKVKHIFLTPKYFKHIEIFNIWSSPSLISYNVFAVQTLINYKIVNILKISWIHKTRRQTSCACTERFDACHILRRAAKFAASLLFLYTMTSIIQDKQSGTILYIIKHCNNLPCQKYMLDFKDVNINSMSW